MTDPDGWSQWQLTVAFAATWKAALPLTSAALWNSCRQRQSPQTATVPHPHLCFEPILLRRTTAVWWPQMMSSRRQRGRHPQVQLYLVDIVFVLYKIQTCVELFKPTKTGRWLMPHTSDTDKTRLSCLILSAVWSELATSQDCWWQKISNMFCPVSKCGVNRVLSCLDPVSNCIWDLFANAFTPQTGLDKTVQSPIYSGVLKTVGDRRQLCSHHRQNKTRQSCQQSMLGWYPIETEHLITYFTRWCHTFLALFSF